jgi:hypothetical protein
VKKKMKKPASPLRTRKKSGENTTGIRKGWDRFFLGGEWKIAGFTHIKPPRLTNEYVEMSASDLVLRIKADSEELAARVWPTYAEEFEAKFPPNHARESPIIPYADRLQTAINEKTADSLLPGLGKN